MLLTTALLAVAFLVVVGPGRWLAWPRDPDTAFVPFEQSPIGAATKPWTAWALPMTDEPDAGTVVLEPRAGHARAMVILVHGGGNDRLYGFWYIAERLLEAGYAVAVFHLPGHGRGGRDVFTLSLARRRLRAVLFALRRQPRFSRFVLLGQSLGGALCLDAVASGVEVDAVVSVSAPAHLRLGHSIAREFSALLQAPIYRVFQYGSLGRVLPAVGKLGRRRHPIRTPPGTGTYVSCFARALGAMALCSRLAQTQSSMRPRSRPSLLVVHGARDGVIGVEQAHTLAQASGAELLVRERMHHMDILLDSATVTAISSWIDETLTRRAPQPAFPEEASA